MYFCYFPQKYNANSSTTTFKVTSQQKSSSQTYILWFIRLLWKHSSQTEYIASAPTQTVDMTTGYIGEAQRPYQSLPGIPPTTDYNGKSATVVGNRKSFEKKSVFCFNFVSMTAPVPPTLSPRTQPVIPDNRPAPGSLRRHARRQQPPSTFGAATMTLDRHARRPPPTQVSRIVHTRSNVCICVQ